ncbi:hypothetical protein NDU88_005552 [Pleurodeles waltl]|uniref:Uncharacterized protein n=1 Tax=Pleurodeles waltl TaxID=8319 RepID=A0AAV7NQL3_PLEWA|nr:hypothetical protein NDU88_005552 [Pleurodeles waltl]
MGRVNRDQRDYVSQTALRPQKPAILCITCSHLPGPTRAIKREAAYRSAERANRDQRDYTSQTALQPQEAAILCTTCSHLVDPTSAIKHEGAYRSAGHVWPVPVRSPSVTN